MSRRPNKRQRANTRLAETRARTTAIPAGIEEEARAPLAGLEDQYEITRSGYVFSLALGRFIKHAYLRGPYIKLTVQGRAITKNINEAVLESWEGLPVVPPGKLYRVDILQRSFVVYARTLEQARNVAADALREEIREGRVEVRAAPVMDEASVPRDWIDARPYGAKEFEDTLGEATVAQLLVPAVVRA